VERYVYSPYGVVTIYDATWTNTRSESSYANVTLYTGRELDSETGLYYYRNRYYSAELGRFVSRDPIGYRVTGYGVGCDDLLARVNACEAARALQRTIEGSRIAALAATNALIDAIGYQQRLNIRRRAFELAGRLQ
jgi:RHS repeat-associated protein